MKNTFFLSIAIALIIGCQDSMSGPGVLVSNTPELASAIANAGPGDEIVMANGMWNDIRIHFYGAGTSERPIMLRAETPGEVIIQGASDLRLSGEHLVVSGLYFTNGASPSRSVIQFALNNDTVANHCRVTQCVVQDFNKAQRNMQDLWVRFKGRYNQLDHCFLAGKSNRGPTIRVDLEGNESINNYHKITHNHFGPRPPKGGPSAETIQIGNSSTSVSPSHTLVAHNLFDRCNGEVEVISSKTNFNEFRNNVFYKSEGSLVTRHGNYCIVDGNYFIGDEDSEHIGGVRLIGTGHWVTNNYFYNLRGKVFRGPLAVMNGIRRSPLNRYIQVTDVVVAYNTYINCSSPWQIGVGSNTDQKDVLPPSEIRSEIPIRTLVANNVIYNTHSDQEPIIRYDSLDGIDFRNNVINNQGVAFRGMEGLQVKDFAVSELEENIWDAGSDLADLDIYDGFEFDQIATDLLGNSRTDKNCVGATNGTSTGKPDIMDRAKYGPDWFRPEASEDRDPKTHIVASSDALVQTLAAAKDGDMIELRADRYELHSSLKIDKRLILKSSGGGQKATIFYSGTEGTAAFQMHPQGQLTLQNINLRGAQKQFAFASLAENMSSLYNLTVEDCEISNFDYVLKAYKYSFSEFIRFQSSTIRNCNNGLELSGEDDDRGEYNAENILVTDCHFEAIGANVIDYYRGGYDESTVGGNLVITGSTFRNCGAKEKNGILLNTYGIINVDVSGNTFRDNPVRQVAQLWGAKNNRHAHNEVENSGAIVVEENLTLKLMY